MNLAREQRDLLSVINVAKEQLAEISSETDYLVDDLALCARGISVLRQQQNDLVTALLNWAPELVDQTMSRAQQSKGGMVRRGLGSIRKRFAQGEIQKAVASTIKHPWVTNDVEESCRRVVEESVELLKRVDSADSDVLAEIYNNRVALKNIALVGDFLDEIRRSGYMKNGNIRQFIEDLMSEVEE